MLNSLSHGHAPSVVALCLVPHKPHCTPQQWNSLQGQYSHKQGQKALQTDTQRQRRVQQYDGSSSLLHLKPTQTNVLAGGGRSATRDSPAGIRLKVALRIGSAMIHRTVDERNAGQIVDDRLSGVRGVFTWTSLVLVSRKRLQTKKPPVSINPWVTHLIFALRCLK